jgi:thiamine-phosphate pyrophosphorylase
MGFLVPRLYPILDSSFVPALKRADYLERLGLSLADAGVGLLEYRCKTGTDADLYSDALVLRAAMPQTHLVLDDRVDVALAAGFDGVHVDAGDLPVAVARQLVGSRRVVGTSASSEDELVAAINEEADYISFGPVFPTTTKQTAARPIGVEGVRRFREVAGPDVVLVAAAGITLETAPAILKSGANSVAVASAIFGAGDAAAEFRRWMDALG